MVRKDDIYLEESTFHSILGSQLSGLDLSIIQYIMIRQPYPIITSDHVTAELGTGLVHIAPAHGSDDFLLAIKYNLQCVNAVNLTGHLHCPSIASLHGRNASRFQNRWYTIDS